MSDNFGGKSFTSTGFGKGFGSGGFGRGFGAEDKELTQAQREMLPFLQFVKEEEGAESKKLKPVQWIFDRLQTGQYVSANAVNAALQNLNEDEPMEKKIIDVLAAMVRGVTGEEKGSYADVIKEHATGRFQELTERELIPGRDDEKFLGQATVADLLGLAGDIFLDPLTYVGGGLAGKATKASKAAATRFADDAVRISVKQMAANIGAGQMDDLARIAASGIDPGKFATLMAKNPDDAVKFLVKNAKGDVARQMNTIYQDAFKTALNTPAEQLEAITRAGIDPFRAAQEAGQLSAREALGEASVRAAEKGTAAALKKQTKAAGKYSHLMDQPRVFDDIASTIDGRYGGPEGGAGQRYLARIFGHEFGVAERGPGAVAKGLDRVGALIKKSPPGELLSKAWWNVAQNGPVGEIRRALGVRDPYQKLIRMRELEEGSQFFLRKAQENMQNVLTATKGHGDEVKQWYVAANDLAEQLSTKRQTFSVFDILKNPVHRQELGIPEEAVESITQIATDVTALMRGWHKEYMEAAGKGYVDNMGFIENYLPTVMKDPAVRKSVGARKIGASAKPGFAKVRSYKRAASETMEANKLKWVFGNLDLTDEQAEALVKKFNISGFEMDLDELLAARAYAQAMVSKRANLMDTFKEFGIPIKDIQGNKKTKDALMKTGQNLSELGLKQVPEKGLNGYLFDKEVADVFGRITKATSGDTLKKTREMFKKYTSWWKGIVTMTPGFHARNWLSNNMTGFVNHGVKWMDPLLDRDATVASIYAISKNNPGGLLDQIGMKMTDYNRILNKTVGDKTIRELADDSIRSGLISEAQMGFSAKDALAGMGQKASANVFSNEFFGRKASQQLGSVIENGSKFKSFMIDYADMMKQAPADAAAKANYAQTAEQYATMNAKKWFIDYENMTDFEKNVMKNVIPFYSWLRRNLANQVEGIIYHPDIYAMFPKARDFIEMQDPNFDPGLVPDWLGGGASVPVGQKEGQTLMYRMDFPWMDLNKVPLTFEEGRFLPRLDVKELKDELVNAAHPAIRQIASLATEKGYDFFRGKELEDWGEAPYALQLLLSNPKTYEWLDGLMRLGGAEEGLKIRKEGKKIAIDPEYAQIIDNAFPFLNQVNYLFYTGTQVIPGLEETIEEMTGIEDKYDKLSQGLKLMSYYTGIKNFPVDMPAEEEKRSRRQYYEARDLRTEARRKLPGYEQRSQEYRDDTDELIDRLERELGRY